MKNIPDKIYIADCKKFDQIIGASYRKEKDKQFSIEYLSKDYVLGLIEKIDSDMGTHSSASAWTAGFSSGLKILKEKL